jgi:tetratricopeptide (TPR) repeat protein
MYAYNPRKKPYRQLEKTLVGRDRWDLLNNILQELAIKEGEGPKQHWMIVGPRGIGKSHLMTLLYYKIKENKNLSRVWTPILFPEDLRMAVNLHRFLERTVKEILLEFEKENNPISNELKEKIEKAHKTPPSERADSFFSLISWFHQKTGKFIILITENLQQLLGRKIPLIEQKKLRAFLQTNDALLMIGSATTIFNALHDHSHPFYHFFHIRRLEDLEFEDMKSLIVDLLYESGNPEMVKEVARKDARLKTLYTFTGGNPRMAVFLSDIFRTEVPDEMLSLMDNILDELTPYFEGILKEIPDYLENIINTLASFEPALSPKEIAQYLEAPQTTIRNYLKQLKENGYVRIAFSRGKSNYYCLNEYLYRIWYQMRDSSHREETRWLMELVLMLYSPKSILKEKKKIETYAQVEKPDFSYREIIVQTAEFMDRNPDYCKIIELCVDSTTDNKKRKLVQQEEKKLLEELSDYIQNNQYEKAIEICKEMIKINPKSEYAYWQWGDSLRDQNRYEEAIEKFKEVIKVDPKSFASYGAMGNCFRELGHYGEAEKHYKKAIKIDPKYYHAYIAWGKCLRNQERYDKATEKIKKAIKINPKSEYAHWEWGAILRDQNLYEEAIEKFKEAIKVDPKSFPSYGAIGDCYRKLSQYEEAVKHYKNAVKINPKSEYAYWLLGDSLLSQGHYEEAISLFEEHFPESKDSDVIFSYGSSLMGAERYDEALKQFEHIIKIEPEYHKVYLSYGQLLGKINDCELALLAYLKHIKLGCDALSTGFDFKKIYIEYVLPLINSLKPNDYVKQFYASEKERRFSEPQLSIFLIFLANYDTVSGHFQDIVRAYMGKNDEENMDFNLLIFTIKLSVWLKLNEGNLYDALRLTDLYIEFIKSLGKIEKKENEVSNFSLSLFKIQINFNIDSEKIRRILEQLKEHPDVPFSDIFFKVWTCLNEPDSLEAQRNLNEKAIAEVVKELTKNEGQTD